MKSKKAKIALDMLGWLIIAVIVLVILVAVIIILKGKGVSILDYIKELFTFRRAG